MCDLGGDTEVTGVGCGVGACTTSVIVLRLLGESDKENDTRMQYTSHIYEVD